ncbi:hypothetical protein [Streptomyces sp. NPDC005077]|uniref:hypothetical protein n=1 Tax=Streptomyces sp. NPDC005077 TaxID=3154292 RepID=UPI0033B5C961
MEPAFSSSAGWESWGLSGKSKIPEAMAFLVDDDLLLEDGRGLRATGRQKAYGPSRPQATTTASASRMALTAII